MICTEYKDIITVCSIFVMQKGLQPSSVMVKASGQHLQIPDSIPLGGEFWDWLKKSSLCPAHSRDRYPARHPLAGPLQSGQLISPLVMEGQGSGAFSGTMFRSQYNIGRAVFPSPAEFFIYIFVIRCCQQNCLITFIICFSKNGMSYRLCQTKSNCNFLPKLQVMFAILTALCENCGNTDIQAKTRQIQHCAAEPQYSDNKARSRWTTC